MKRKLFSFVIILVLTGFFYHCDDSGDDSASKATRYTVTFDSLGGSETSSQTVNAGDKLVEPIEPTKSTYTFAGWFKESACENSWIFSSDTVNANITLYAKWTIDQYTVNFNTQGGSAVSSQTIDLGGLVTQPDDPTKTEDCFLSWYKESTCVNEWNFSSDTVTGNMTLYAKWISFLEKRELINITGGTFNQYDSYGTECFSHTISSFRIAKYEVTYELWYTVYQWAINNGYTFSNKGTEGHDGAAGAAPTEAKYEPVTNINWRDAIVWCNAYSEMTGLSPVYYQSYSTLSLLLRIPLRDSRYGDYRSTIDTTAGSFDNPYVRLEKNGYRLPSEGEWQFVASYKGNTPYNYASGAVSDYTNATATGNVAWYNLNSGSITHDVGEKNANSLGIYDMSGNISEWCWDWYGDYPVKAQEDYQGPSDIESVSSRIERGGNYFNEPVFLSIASRCLLKPYMHGSNISFRVAKISE